MDGGSKYLKAYDYPKVSSNRSSDTPSVQIADKLSRTNAKQIDLIKLTEGDITITEQQGGKLNIYEYIINPETNRKVGIYTKKGREIINNYFILTKI